MALTLSLVGGGAACGIDAALTSGAGEGGTDATSGDSGDTGQPGSGGDDGGGGGDGGPGCGTVFCSGSCCPSDQPVCTAARNCAASCRDAGGACSSDNDCCHRSFCGDAGQCTCFAQGVPGCTSDTQCCSQGSSCDVHGDSGVMSCGN